MRNLRKDTGGYALLYVLVVIILLCAVAMMICTVSMQNLTAQQKSVERMVDKYAAQGEVEKILAQIPNIQETADVSTNDGTKEQNVLETEARDNALKDYVNAICALDPDPDDDAQITIQITPIAEKSNHKKVIIVSKEKTSNVSAEIEVSFTNAPNYRDENKVISYTCKTDKVTMIAYNIENGGAA